MVKAVTFIMRNSRTGKAKQFLIPQSSVTIGKSPDGGIVIILTDEELSDHFYDQFTVIVPGEMIP